MDKEPKLTGVKHDQGKPRMELLPEEALLEIAKVLAGGSVKYGEDWNWYKGFKYSRLYGATRRHMAYWSLGEDNDAETNINHLAHAACNLLFLLSFEINKKGEDDRCAR